VNEKIKQLAKQAGIWFEDAKAVRTHSVSTTTLEKFAELIIKDCASVSNRAWNDAGTYPGNLVLKHFGVKGE
jgi:hypothetical protein